MPAPVASITPATPSPAGTAIGGPATLGSLIANGNSMFATMLSLGGVGAQATNATPETFTMSASTALKDGAAVADTSAAQGAQFPTSLMLKNGLSLDPSLLVSSEDGSPMTSEDLQTLLSNLGNTDTELNSKILVAMTPGTPAQDVLDNVKTQLAALGVDTSKFKAIVVKTATPHTDTGGVPMTNPLAMDTASADGSQNFLLVATGLTPSEMGPLKNAIQSSLTDSEIDGTLPKDTATDITTDINADAATMILVVYVMPPKQVEAAAPQDMSFDLSALSAFTQPTTDGVEEPDWTKKLSDKLSNMTMPTGEDDVSPFDDEMNSILSFDAPKKAEAGFQGSQSLAKGAAEAKAEGADKPAKVAAGEMTTQTSQMFNHLGVSTSTLNASGDPSLLYANNGMMGAHQTAANITNPILTSSAATSSHPSIHAVASLIEKSASGSEKARQELTVELDPPELGRMQIQLSMEKDGAMKVHLLAEKQDTLALFQRDSHALKHALDQAGVQVDSSSLTFDLASGDQSFNQLMGGSQDQTGAKTSHLSIGTDGSINDMDNMSVVESKMDFRADNVTGNVHYSFLA